MLFSTEQYKDDADVMDFMGELGDVYGEIYQLMDDLRDHYGLVKGKESQDQDKETIINLFGLEGAKDLLAEKLVVMNAICNKLKIKNPGCGAFLTEFYQKNNKGIKILFEDVEAKGKEDAA